ncbi:unnamed protein product [Microthlaspi erraticum]|uniref:tRNA(Phe) 7-[(3-amino-3-carboxypropyl)-4-demethylwyosine(37)-N(4)]-methyltransferase n=1 Tax=Microthlaspi erraticum TaxID=1685480 RepID=A0A6D2I9I3_9BRAS|nr:unnamed protein product [Microthlaspi erraticum]
MNLSLGFLQRTGRDGVREEESCDANVTDKSPKGRISILSQPKPQLNASTKKNARGGTWLDITHDPADPESVISLLFPSQSTLIDHPSELVFRFEPLIIAMECKDCIILFPVASFHIYWIRFLGQQKGSSFGISEKNAAEAIGNGSLRTSLPPASPFFRSSLSRRSPSLNPKTWNPHRCCHEQPYTRQVLKTSLVAVHAASPRTSAKTEPNQRTTRPPAAREPLRTAREAASSHQTRAVKPQE